MREERRRAARSPVSARVRGMITWEIATALVDVSATGALVEHLQMMRPGSVYQIRFVAREAVVDLACRAVRSYIVRTQTSGEENELVYRTGLEFVEPDAAAVSELLAATQA